MRRDTIKFQSKCKNCFRFDSKHCDIIEIEKEAIYFCCSSSANFFCIRWPSAEFDDSVEVSCLNAIDKSKLSKLRSIQLEFKC